MRCIKILLLLFMLSGLLLAQVSRIMNYQGKLTTDSGVALNGTYDIVFYILKYSY